LEGTGLGFFRFFFEPYHPSAGVHFDDAEMDGLFDGFLDRGDRCDGPDVPVEIEHLGNIHFVNMVRAEHREIIGVLVFNEVHVLENGVGGAHIPIPPVRICAGTGSMYWPASG